MRKIGESNRKQRKLVWKLKLLSVLKIRSVSSKGWKSKGSYRSRRNVMKKNAFASSRKLKRRNNDKRQKLKRKNSD